MEVIKSCPFCAFPYPNVVVLPPDDKERFTLKYMVVCDYRHGGCGAASGWCASVQEAIDSWNQRKKKYGQKEGEGKCKKCGICET